MKVLLPAAATCPSAQDMLADDADLATVFSDAQAVPRASTAITMCVPACGFRSQLSILTKPASAMSLKASVDEYVCRRHVTAVAIPMSSHFLDLDKACRELSQLSPFTDHVACFLARDTVGNVQDSVSRLEFSTTDSSLPVLSARLQPGSKFHTLTGSSCGFTLEIQVNEAANATFLLLPDSSGLDPDSFSASQLFESDFAESLPVSAAAEGTIDIVAAQANSFVGVSVNAISCDSTFVVRPLAHGHHPVLQPLIICLPCLQSSCVSYERAILLGVRWLHSSLTRS